MAFSIEAMLNHFGQILFDDWDTDRLDRKKLHKKLFGEVNLPDYLGTREYQNAKKCFDLRDLLAHGKTIEETIIIKMPDDISRDEVVHAVTSIRSKSHRNTSCEVLKVFIDTARKIERDIQMNGYYPNQLDLPKEQIPISHTILFEWFKEFDKVSNKDRYEKLMALWLKENPLKINADMPKKKIIDKNKYSYN